MRQFKLTDIVWDKEVDGEVQEIDLPSTMKVEAEDEDEDDAVDVASDLSCYCIKSATIIAI